MINIFCHTWFLFAWNISFFVLLRKGKGDSVVIANHSETRSIRATAINLLCKNKCENTIIVLHVYTSCISFVFFNPTGFRTMSFCFRCITRRVADSYFMHHSRFMRICTCWHSLSLLFMHFGSSLRNNQEGNAPKTGQRQCAPPKLDIWAVRVWVSYPWFGWGFAPKQIRTTHLSHIPSKVL